MSVQFRLGVVLGLLCMPLVVQALDGPPAKPRRVVDTAIDYPPPYEPLPHGGGLGGGGLGGGGLGGHGSPGDASYEPHIHFPSEPCGWQCRLIRRMRKGEETSPKPVSLDGYECDLAQHEGLKRAAAEGIRVWEPHLKDKNGISIPPVGRIPDALRGLRTIPKDRLEYSSWLWTTPMVVNGWSGRVVGVERVPGGERVKVDIRPEGTIWGRLFFPVNYIETYLLHDDGRLEYLGGDGRPEYRGKCVIAAF